MKKRKQSKKKTVIHVKIPKQSSKPESVWPPVFAILAIILIVVIVNFSMAPDLKTPKAEKTENTLTGKASSCSPRTYCYDDEYIVRVLDNCHLVKSWCEYGCSEPHGACKVN